MKAKILIVDDEGFSAVFLEELLSDQFSFDYASNGEEAMTAATTGNPAVILMDVEMPGGKNGYEVCRDLKDDDATKNIPVIFISAHSKEEDRLKGYESGGDDYISKPFNPDELRHKITIALSKQEQRNELADKARQSDNIALISMRETANMGVILGFLSDIIRQSDLEEIANITLRTLQQFNIEGSIQLRNGYGRISRNSQGPCSAIEESVLDKMASNDRIVDLGKRSAFNYEGATIIIYNMPRESEELYGQMKGTVLKITETLDVHVRTLQFVLKAKQRGEALLKLLQNNAKLLHDIERRIKEQRYESSLIMNRLVNGIEHSFVSLGLNEGQEVHMQKLLHDAQEQSDTLYADGVKMDKHMASMLTGVDDSLIQELHLEAEAPVAQ